MQWPGLIRQGLSPIFAIGIITASIFTAVSMKSNPPVVENLASQASNDTTAASLWNAGMAKVESPVRLADLTETGDTTGSTWIETRNTPAVVGRTFGKLVVTREFGPSDEADAVNIVGRPQDHLVAITMGFRPFAGDTKKWFWARFAPDGSLLDTTGEMPSIVYLAALADAHCSVSSPQEITASG